MSLDAQSTFDGLIYIVLERVPAIVKQFVRTNCVFAVLENHVAGTTLRVNVLWVIVLNGELLTRYDAEGGLSIIAHEIAHAWLGHNSGGLGTLEEERAAAQTAAAWGFTGFGALSPDER